MRYTTLIVPGLHGSGPKHWQSWLERQEPSARRVSGIDWDTPLLPNWAGQVRREIDQALTSVWLIAHSFGCLATMVAAADRPDKVAGAILVAPADPDQASVYPLRQPNALAVGGSEATTSWLPREPLAMPSIVIASSNDPCVKLVTAFYWAERWGSRFIDLGPAGHINVDSGFGPWPFGLELLRSLQAASRDVPLGPIAPSPSKRRGSTPLWPRARLGPPEPIEDGELSSTSRE